MFCVWRKMGKRPQMQQSVQLHIVQEMLEFCAMEVTESDDSEEDLMVLSAETQSDQAVYSTIKLNCELANF